MRIISADFDSCIRYLTQLLPSQIFFFLGKHWSEKQFLQLFEHQPGVKEIWRFGVFTMKTLERKIL